MSDGSNARTAVVTGASSGIGKATAVMFAQMGWQVIGVGRNPERSATAEAAIRAASNGGKVTMLRGDFELMSDVARIASEIAGLTDRLDVLINNAGNMRNEIKLTPEGNEITFASNHLAPFLLTRQLMPLLRNTAATGPAGNVRVLATSSSGHEMSPAFDWDDLQLTKPGIHPGQTYCLAKLANIHFIRELGRREVANGIIAQVMHPGVIDSNFISHTQQSTQDYMNSLDLNPPETAAETLVWMAISEECGHDSGRYFHRLAEAPTSEAAQSKADAKRLWDESERLVTGLGY
jgi:NAD(P)-dependent dehydrogenase (short-subunit alcohol dehydrogenase family)